MVRIVLPEHGATMRIGRNPHRIVAATFSRIYDLSGLLVANLPPHDHLYPVLRHSKNVVGRVTSFESGLNLPMGRAIGLEVDSFPAERTVGRVHPVFEKQRSILQEIV